MSDGNQRDRREDKKDSELHHLGEFLHNYYAFESVYDSDHDGIVFPADSVSTSSYSKAACILCRWQLMARSN